MPTPVPGRNGGTLHALLPGETANPNGRPRKLVSQVIADLRMEGAEPVTPQRVKDAYEVLLGLTFSEVQRIAGKLEGKASTENEYPLLLRLVAKAMLGGKGNEMVEKMLDRAHGKPTQSADVFLSGGEKNNSEGVEWVMPLSSAHRKKRWPVEIEAEDAEIEGEE